MTTMLPAPRRTRPLAQQQDPPGQVLHLPPLTAAGPFGHSDGWGAPQRRDPEVTSEDDDGDDDDDEALLGTGDDEDDGLFIGCGGGGGGIGGNNNDDDDVSVAFSDIILPTEENDPFLQELKAEQEAAGVIQAPFLVVEQKPAPPAVTVPPPPTFSPHAIVAQNMANRKEELMKLSHQELRERLEKRLRPYMKIALNVVPASRPRKRPNCRFLNHFGSRRAVPPPQASKKRRLVQASAATIVAKETPVHIKEGSAVVTGLPQKKGPQVVPISAPSSPTKSTIVPCSNPAPCLLPKMLLDEDSLWKDDLVDTSTPIVKATRKSPSPTPLKAKKPKLSRKPDSAKSTVTAAAGKKEAPADKTAKVDRKAQALRDMALMRPQESKAKNDAMKDMAAMKMHNVAEVVKQADSSSISLESSPVLMHDPILGKSVVTPSTHNRECISSDNDSLSISSKIVTVSNDNAAAAIDEDDEASLFSMNDPLPLSLEGSFHHLTSNPEALSMLVGEEQFPVPTARPVSALKKHQQSKKKKKKQVRVMLLSEVYIADNEEPAYTSPRPERRCSTSMVPVRTLDSGRHCSKVRPMLLSPEIDMFADTAQYEYSHCQDMSESDYSSPSTPPPMASGRRVVHMMPAYTNTSFPDEDEDYYNDNYLSYATAAAPYITPDAMASNSPFRSTKVLHLEPGQEEMLLRSYTSPPLADHYGGGYSDYYFEQPEDEQSPSLDPYYRQQHGNFASNPAQKQSLAIRRGAALFPKVSKAAVKSPHHKSKKAKFAAKVKETKTKKSQLKVSPI